MIAAYDAILSVGAIDCTGKIAPFSSQNDDVELAAPGSTVLSTIVPLVEDITSLKIQTPDTKQTISIDSSPVTGSDLGKVRGPLSDCAIGNYTCPGGKGKICLVSRSTMPDYSCKMANAMKAGCIAMIITSDWDPPCAPLQGRVISGKCETEDQVYLPVVATSKYDGDLMREMMKKGSTIGDIEIIPGKYKSYTRQLAGTSMAAPHVTGVAARIWADFPGCNNTDVRLALQQGSKQVGTDGKNNAYGYGLLQAVSSRNILAARECATAAV